MEQKLVYDVGAFDGSDTAYYLSQGYRVVCIEATPALAEKLTERFAPEIEARKCVVLNIAVGDREEMVPFYTCGFQALNSFDKSRIESAGIAPQEITVPMRRFDSIREYLIFCV